MAGIVSGDKFFHVNTPEDNHHHPRQDGVEPGKEERAVIVGATGAMGSKVAHRLTAAGMRVLAVARNEERLKELAESSELITPCTADIGDDAAIEAIRARLDGPVRLALFAAGLPVRGSVDTTEPGHFTASSNIKISGLVRLLHAVRDRLEAGSRFIAVAGALGLQPSAHEAVPGAINAGVFNLMRQISLLYGPRGVTTHTISPGPFDSPRFRRVVATIAEERGEAFDEVWQAYLKNVSLGRLATLDEIAWSVTMLLAPEAALLHGSVLNFDGGFLRGIH